MPPVEIAWVLGVVGMNARVVADLLMKDRQAIHDLLSRERAVADAVQGNLETLCLELANEAEIIFVHQRLAAEAPARRIYPHRLGRQNSMLVKQVIHRGQIGNGAIIRVVEHRKSETSPARKRDASTAWHGHRSPARNAAIEGAGGLIRLLYLDGACQPDRPPSGSAPWRRSRAASRNASWCNDLVLKPRTMAVQVR